ncbi:hypothetical protein QUF64_09085 [Anaerolineales bacterium HSG6]|nr:hypothetical protein [Anaerolineales bacterium HSG6]
MMVNRVGLLILNQLANQPHNAYVKCFASRKKAKQAAFQLLDEVDEVELSNKLWWFVSGLGQLVLPQQEESMPKLEITPEDVMKLGKDIGETLLLTMPLELRLKGLKPEEQLHGLKPEERLHGLKPEEKLSVLKPYLEEREQQVERQAVLRTVRRTLKIRFKLSTEQLDKFDKPLGKLDLVTLENLSEVAVIAETLPEFEAKLKQFLPPDIEETEVKE